ncbi:HpcH/HpaI aldolase/citrate lyase family protein [Sphingomonas sp. 3-13AW]|uniref:HpcH/HpaI aldolase/citrate lyase family protein n=1 Tax=Sphingomonas sp. 3-13AW TaxID=3050450 RepID=UPI003BB52989
MKEIAMTGARSTVSALQLGATLYMPALREDAIDFISGARIPELKSVVLCLEDAIRDDQVEQAIHQLGRTLNAMSLHRNSSVLTFIRPRNPEMLARLMRMRSIDWVDGFVLPKITASTLDRWTESLNSTNHLIMPTVETEEAFDPAEMKRLRDKLQTMRDRVLAIRIGGNDLLSCLGARRSRSRTLYEGPLGPVIASLVGTFIPYGFSMSSPVLEMFANLELLREELDRDLEHGLIAKTAIHPSQIETIHAAYRVSPEDLEDARRILAADAAAVFKSHGAMCEPQTHRTWATHIIERAEHYGVTEAALRAVA